MKTFPLHFSRRFSVASVVLFSLLLHIWAMARLGVDADEPTYLAVAHDYATALRGGDLNALVDYPANREHPALAKVLYGLSLLPLSPGASQAQELFAARTVAVALGTIAVLLLALIDPLAGLLLALQTIFVKYTSLVYLEALPLCAMLATVLALRRSVRERDVWFWLSAVMLGVMVAGKFAYYPIGVVLLYVAIWEKRFRWFSLLLYGVVALSVFYLLNPFMWRDPFGWLAYAIDFHIHYSQGAHVQSSGYPWYQPVVWLTGTQLMAWHPETFFYSLDGVIFVLAMLGLVGEWRQRRWVSIWVVSSLLVLLWWPTKWPHYTLVLVPALCLSASTALTMLARWTLRRLNMMLHSPSGSV